MFFSSLGQKEDDGKLKVVALAFRLFKIPVLQSERNKNKQTAGSTEQKY